MKLNLGLRFPRLRRSSPAAPAIKIRSYVIILITTLVPLSLFFVFAYSQLSNVVLDNAISLAETLRDARTERISASVGGAFRNATSSAAYALDTGTLTGYNSPDTLKPLSELIDREVAVEQVVIYNEFYEPLAGVGREGDLAESELSEPILLKLQDLAFDSESTILELDTGDRNSRLILFSRLPNETRVRGYATVIYSYDELERLASAPNRSRISIYNGRYQRIADSLGAAGSDVLINPQTERMLDGFSETVRLETDVHSYGYIDFETTELFIDVVVPLAIGSNRMSSFVVTFIFFTLTAVFASLVVAWAHVRSILKYGEAILIRNRFTKEMSFFTRFVNTLDEVQNKLANLNQMQPQFSELRRDISVIKDELPPGDSEDAS